MAFSLPSTGGVAATYAANFRPVQPIPGFGNVRSDIATDLLSQLPAAQFAAELQLARDALAAEAGIKKQRLAGESALDLVKEQKKQTKAQKLLGILQATNQNRMAGDLIDKEAWEFINPKQQVLPQTQTGATDLGTLLPEENPYAGPLEIVNAELKILEKSFVN